MALWTETQIKEYAAKLLRTSGLDGNIAEYVSEATREIYNHIGVTYDEKLLTDLNTPDDVKDAVRCLATSKAVFFNYVDKPNAETYIKVSEKLRMDAFEKVKRYADGTKRYPNVTMIPNSESSFALATSYDNVETERQDDFYDCIFNTDFLP